MKKYERLAFDYANEPNSVDNFTLADIMLMKTAYEIGFTKAIELAIDRARYSRFSIVLQNDGFTLGYIKACQDIENRVKDQLEKEE